MCVDDLVSGDTWDWVTPMSLVSLVVGKRRSFEARRALGIAIVEHGLRQGLLTIGDVRDDFVPWEFADVNEAVARAEAETYREESASGIWFGF